MPCGVGAEEWRPLLGSVSYWQAEAALATPEAVAPLRGTYEADVAVIGAGITGTALAIELAGAGMHVAVVEARRVASGASGRNGGFLLGGTAGTYAEASARYGHERARRIWAFSQGNNALARERIGELAALGWDSGYRQTGSMRLACAEAELEAIHTSVAQLQRDGWTAQLIAREDLPPRLRAHYLGGSYHPGDGEIQPARFVRGLAELARRAGAIVFEESPVTGLHEDGEGVTVQTEEGALHARQLVLATNAWLPQLGTMLGQEWLAAAITPTRGQMLVTEPVGERLFECPYYADEGYQYWRQLPDGRLAVGGWRNRSLETEYTDDETPGASVQDHLERFVREILDLSGVKVERRWAGIMAFSADHLPLVGRVPGTERCFVAGGYTGHGNAYALAAAHVLSALLRGEAHPDADLFAPARLMASSSSVPIGGHEDEA
jgi:gamma-glutamylputrescine oxidase